MLNINDITARGLLDGQWEKELPELYELQGVRENSGWHQDEESVFHHTVMVYGELEKLLKLEDEVMFGMEDEIGGHLKKNYGNKTGGELLKIMVLWHDVAKKEALIDNQDGKTACPGHEYLSSRMPGIHGDKFGMGEVEKTRVKDMILLHDLPHNVLEILTSREDIVVDDYAVMMREVLGDMTVELMFFCMADMRGCDFPRYFLQEYEVRVGKWVELMESLVV